MEKPLWAPWRMEYILAPKKDSCVFCGVKDASDSGMHERHIVYRASTAFVMLNKYPFAAGHLLVVPYAHCDAFEKLSLDEYRNLFDLVRDATSCLKQAVRCEGVNVGINLGLTAGAGIAEHLHVHIVPRWTGDTNFMPVLADTRIIPQALEKTREYLEQQFKTFFERSSNHGESSP